MKLHCTSSQISKIPTIYKKWPPQILLIFHSSFQKSFTCDRQWCWYMYIFANQYSLYMYDYMYMPWTFCTCNVKTKCMCNTTIFRQKLKKTCKKSSLRLYEYWNKKILCNIYLDLHIHWLEFSYTRISFFHDSRQKMPFAISHYLGKAMLDI